MRILIAGTACHRCLKAFVKWVIQALSSTERWEAKILRKDQPLLGMFLFLSLFKITEIVLVLALKSIAVDSIEGAGGVAIGGFSMD